MQFTSPYNGKAFIIADEKLPNVAQFAMKCPFTGMKILFNRQGNEIFTSAAEEVSGSSGMPSQQISMQQSGPRYGEGVSTNHQSPQNGQAGQLSSQEGDGLQSALSSSFQALPKIPRPMAPVPKAPKVPVHTSLEPWVPHRPIPDNELPVCAPDFIPAGMKSVLVYVRDGGWREDIIDFFKEKGYYIAVPETELEAVARLRHGDYFVLVFDGGEGTFHLHTEVSVWPGMLRRRLNVIMLGKAAEASNPLTAFLQGVNFYFSIEEKEDRKDLLKTALKGYTKYYHLFVEGQKMALSGE